MKFLKDLNQLPAGFTVTSDELVEFHITRILLLLRICGIRQKDTNALCINGLTKFAKLDFFVRYPESLKRVANLLGKDISFEDYLNESRMIRFHYGPWDQRYDTLIIYLLSRNLITIHKDENRFDFLLTKLGEEVSDELIKLEEFQKISRRIEEVNGLLGKFTGSKLKKLIYELFDKEVAEKKLGETI